MDLEADNERHKKEERNRQHRRREKRANKSDAQREKEARRKEHSQKIIAEQSKNRKTSRSRSPKPPPPSVDKGTSKFQALFNKRSEGFLIDLNFRNAAPRPPVGPCFVGLGIEGELNDKWTRYKPNNAVEANYSWKLHAEPDLGVPLAPSAMDLEGCYVDPTKEKKEAYDELFDDDETDEKKENNKGPAPLHPDDEAIINWKGGAGDSAAEELKKRRDMARAEARKGSGMNLTTGPQQQISLAKRKEGRQTRVLDEQNPFFMKKTTYLANDPTQSVHRFKSLAETKAKAAIEVAKQLQSNKLSDKDTAVKSFEIANRAGAKRAHPTKKNVEAMEEIPLLPDDITWGYTFTHVVLDNLPKMDSKRELTSKQLESAYIADTSKGKNLRMECSLLVTDDDNSDSSKGMYNAVQRYDLDVVPLKEVNAPHSNFLFVVDEEKKVAHYHPISSRVQLSTGRPDYNDAGTRSILKRKLEEVELTDLEKTLAEVDADLAKKHGIEEDNDETQNSATRQNPFTNADSSDDSDEGF